MSLLFAATYSWLAGFAVATERALIMVLVWSLLRWLKRDWPSHRIWLWAFVVLTLWDPFALYSAGFWLSFLAVALLLLASLLHDRPGLVRLQLLLLLGLLPLQLLLFEGMAPLAFLLNLLALPLFCLVIIPLALIGVLVAPLSTLLAHGLLWVSAFGLEWVLWGLTQLADRLQLWWPVPGWLMPASALLILLWTGWHLPGGRALGGRWRRPCCSPSGLLPLPGRCGCWTWGRGSRCSSPGGIGPSCLIPGIATPGATTWRMRPSCPCSTGSASG